MASAGVALFGVRVGHAAMKFGTVLKGKRAEGPEEFRGYYLRCVRVCGWRVASAIWRQQQQGRGGNAPGFGAVRPLATLLAARDVRAAPQRAVPVGSRFVAALTRHPQV